MDDVMGMEERQATGNIQHLERKTNSNVDPKAAKLNSMSSRRPGFVL